MDCCTPQMFIILRGGVQASAPPRRTSTRISLLAHHVLQDYSVFHTNTRTGAHDRHKYNLSFAQIKEQTHHWFLKDDDGTWIVLKCHISKCTFFRDEAIGRVRLHMHALRRRGGTNVRKNREGGTGLRGVHQSTNYYRHLISSSILGVFLSLFEVLNIK